MALRLILKSAILSLFLLRFMMCAVQGPPSGGPVDDIRPVIIDAFPLDSLTGVPLDAKIMIEFSEGMNKKSVETSFFMSPRPHSVPEFKWKKNTMTVNLDEPLAQDRTFVMSIGTSSSDMRNNNLEQSFTWAFSTGGVLDKGMLSGSVHGTGESSGALVWAYLLENSAEPDPFSEPGDYVTQTGGDGYFLLSYLKPGVYRVFVIIDENEDFSFHSSLDKIAVPPGDILVNEAVNSRPFRFQPVSYDTLAPELYMVEAMNEHVVRILFNEELIPETVRPQNVKIINSETGEEIPDAVRAVYQESAQHNDMIVYAENLIPGMSCQLIFNGIADIAGNLLQDYSDSNTVFIASMLPDTAAFSLIEIFPADSATNVSSRTPVKLKFNSLVTLPELAPHIIMTDSTGAQVQGTWSENSPVEFLFISSGNLELSMQYTIAIRVDSIYNISGKMLNNDVSVNRFSTESSDGTGDLLGTLRIEGNLDSAQVIVLVTSEDENGVNREIRLNEQGPFTVSGLNPGNYRLKAFADLDGNNRWTPGRIKPFLPAEPFVLYEESIAVRAGIDNRLQFALLLYVY